MADVRVLLATNIKRGRQLLGLSQMDLAERIGCSSGYLGDIEQCKKFPAADMLGKIAESLSFQPYQLFLEDRDDQDQAATVVTIQRQLEAKLAEAAHDATVQFQALLKPKG